MHHSVHGRGKDRAQSETLGVVLLLGIAILGAVTVAATGYAALDRDSQRIGLAQAERSLSQFDSRTSDVALGRSESTRVDFGLPTSDGTMRVRPDDGWVRVRISGGPSEDGGEDRGPPEGAGDGPPDDPGDGPPDNPGNGPPDDPGDGPPDNPGDGGPPSDALVANVTLGSVTYQQSDRTVGYQSGGVFRSDEDNSTVVSRPEFHYRRGTLTIPVVRVEGDPSFASVVQATHGGSVRKFPDPDRDLTNEIDGRTVTLTVKSRYYRAWATYFREETPGAVTVEPSAQTVTVVFDPAESQLDFLHVTAHRLTVNSR